MNEILKSKYSRFFIAGLALTIFCAWFSVGFHHADEHFQILEFCNYKMGYTPAIYMPWEFQQKMRAAFLPGIAYVIGEAMNMCHLYNPFVLAFLLRLLTGIVSWFITCKFCLLLLPKFKTPEGKRLLILMSFFLWFIPYMTIRFTAENVSGILLLYGVYAILRINEKTTNTYLRFIAAGLLFGITFFIRTQMSFAIAGFLSWLIFINKTKWKYIIILGISSIVAIGFNILIDRWFYGGWILTPYNYYFTNIVKHMAAEFGTSPWWFYFSDLILKAIPPLSIFLLIAFFVGAYKNLREPFTWIIIPFFLIHCFIGHKELRFLFPVTFIFIYLAALGIDTIIEKNYYPKTFKYLYKISLIICIPLLLYRTFTPANISVNYYKYIYNNADPSNSVLFFMHDINDYSMYGMRENFYRNPELKTMSVDSTSQIEQYLRLHRPESVFLMNMQGFAPAEKIKGYQSQLVYCFFPSWMAKFDFNNWEERSTIWSIYRYTKME